MFLAIFKQADLCIIYITFQLYVNDETQACKEGGIRFNR